MRHLLMFFTLVIGLGSLVQAQFSGGVANTKVPLSADELQKRCDGGNAIACDDLGVRYLKGDGVAKDAKKSAALFQRACDGGDAVGCYDLAESYRFGDGVAKSSAQAAAFYQRGCDGGNANSCAKLAIHYSYGDGVKQDGGKAALYADRSCKGGSGMGCTLLGAVYAEGATLYPKDIKRAEELFTDSCFSKVDFNKAPDNVSRAACSALSKLTGNAPCSTLASLDGSTTKSCYAPAAQAWKVTIIPAAQNLTAVSAAPSSPQVDPMVAANAAVIAGNSAYGRKDFAVAAGQYAIACDAGSASACGALGDMYVKGEGVSRNGARAAAPLAKACDEGVATACGSLASLYDNGNGVGVNKARAFSLFNGACSQSVVTACYNLGRLYEGGQGTARNVSMAATLYQQACNAGIADGCSNIGTMYANGVHFASSETQAESYYNLGCSKGSKISCQKVETLVATREAIKQTASTEVKRGISEKNRPGQSTVTTTPKLPIDCIKATVVEKKNIARPPRGTYTECREGECKEYYQDDVSQFMDDFLFGVFNAPKPSKFYNQCSVSIEVIFSYTENSHLIQLQAGGPRLNDFSYIFKSNEEYYYGPNNVSILSAKWAGL